MESNTKQDYWLSLCSYYINGVVMSTIEFRDSINVRLGKIPKNISGTCAFGSKFDYYHAMT